ncbi:hypothetical protein DPMN_027586 [Dreissena polymorpha]|uniref:Uncharacterized protein n=1 Tax=Dreissena polymorpha TaxID=45954 RepID=A0A9D4LVK4_DREPO|nr:hypothetical protein DPMN_027586 [Dreissena polymorpha]
MNGYLVMQDVVNITRRWSIRRRSRRRQFKEISNSVTLDSQEVLFSPTGSPVLH